LFKGAVLERIAAAACARQEALVVEIGPGRGSLTEKLLKRARRVIAIELDLHLVEHLRRKFTGEERLEIVHGDVLEAELTQWQGAPVVGNLPYYIASPVLEKVARLGPPKAVFLIQKEVAGRLVAQPGQREYGFLTVQIALRAEARLLFEVKPSAFHPPPKVDSAVVLLEPRKTPPAIGDTDAFLEFVSQCFRHKRKTIRNNLAEIYGRERIDAWPEAGFRAEQIALDRFVEMYGRLQESHCL
jgi:16S rRNA (adenine1518-N6/adenine1519-N6)-dimethyltransferase